MNQMVILEINITEHYKTETFSMNVLVNVYITNIPLHI